MRAIFGTAIAAATLMAACAAPPPDSPAERHARLAAAAELAARSCAGYAGGYMGVQHMREDANQNIVAARQHGASDAMIEQARTDVETSFNGTVFWTSQQYACNQLISDVAWESN